MKREFKLWWVAIGLLASLALLAMASGCTYGATAETTTPASATPAAGSVKVSGSSYYQPSASTDPAPAGIFTDKAKGTYYGPGKSLPFTLRIPAATDENGSWAAVDDDGTMPIEYTCNGASKSPALEWSGEPKGTKEFALIVWHKPPDYATNGTKCYWILYNIPNTVHSLKIGNTDKIGFYGLNEHHGYEFEPTCSAGPGLKTYIYTLYALDDSPQWKAETTAKKLAAGNYEGVTREIMWAAIKDNILAAAGMRINTDVGNLGLQSGAAPAKPAAPAPAK